MSFKSTTFVNLLLHAEGPSWSDDSTAPSEASTPPSSIGSPFGETIPLPAENATQLPSPFYPASLVQQDPDHDEKSVIPRGLPSTLQYPEVPSLKACKNIDAPDVGSPDDWIPRDPRMLRLTGKHPFNAEAPMRDLFAQGFLTPTNLFYTRNHGAVPRIDQQMASEWKVKIHGLCSRPVTFTLEDLRSKFRVVTLPVTLVCAGNRRGEQNVVRKSLGFSWGAAGLSTALFTGVYLADVLEYVLPSKGAKHVIFEGSDSLPNGPYGTSQLMSWARDKKKGMMLAWALNGLPLEPDHGFPLRLVVPSQIGGRSVKWLARIELAENESQHHLHFHDNKVIPTTVSPDQARAEKDWWHDPRYIIRELNVNSAIACPSHQEVLDPSIGDGDSTYEVKGYAYGGGGRRITRVEISSDDGESWSLANITYPEDQFRAIAHSDPVYGDLDLTDSDMCFCWCFWSFKIPIASLKRSRVITVRAMDESMAPQPRDMYWNATGMMNNCWYRVCIHTLDDGKLSFEHPMVIGAQHSGWVQRLKDEGSDPTRPVFSAQNPDVTSRPDKPRPQTQEMQMTKPGINRKIAMEELTSIQAKEEAWFVVKGEVYNGSAFFNDHPGGAQSIQLAAGEDATDDFMAIHSSDAKRRLANQHIGTLISGSANVQLVSAGETNPSKTFLNPKTWKKVILSSVTEVSSDTQIFRFALESEEQELGLPFGQHVYVRLRRKVPGKDGALVAEGELVQRAYTPLSQRDDKGFIDILIKIYYPTHAFPAGGRMTMGFSELVVGDSVELKGPIGHFIWKGKGVASLHGKDRFVKEVGLICGGSGITPVLQVARAILTDPEDTQTIVRVVDVNRNLEDILCKEELERFVTEHKERFSLHLSLTGKPLPEHWKHSAGRITKEMLEDHLPTPEGSNLVCICGPGPMEQCAKGFLEELGWDVPSQVVLF